MFIYDKLWSLLKSKNLKKIDLRDGANISPATLSKLSKNENVSMAILDKICVFLECDIGDILEHAYTPYKDDATLGTFLPNKNEIIHNWFGYLEGYSKKLVENEIESIGNVKAIYDPFGGSGTTPLVAVMNGLNAYYSEANPVMAYISKVKTKSVFEMYKNPNNLITFKQEKTQLLNYIKLVDLEAEASPFGGFEKYYEKENLILIQNYIEYVDNKVKEQLHRDLFNMALAGVAVPTSKMIRRGDLRYAKGKEIERTNKNFIEAITEKLDDIIEDIINIPTNTSFGKSKFLSLDVRDLKEESFADAIITSPPYLNGTNYIRNTKLELKLLNFVQEEKELAQLHKTGIVAGINNVSKNSADFEPIPEIETIYNELLKVSYDSRIQKMIAGYFNDMSDVFDKMKQALKNNGVLVMDIGDSQFAGVHVPTHEILIKIAEQKGFELYSEEIIRKRRSNSGFELSQRILRFKLRENKSTKDEEIDPFKKEAKDFISEQKYKSKGRNWGNSWHSLCSYRGKLKPAIAAELVERFSKEDEIVLDPMGGVGTIALEANIQGRVGISNDLSILAFNITTGKINPPSYKEVEKDMKKVENYIEKNKLSFTSNKQVKEFGLNKKIIDYYHEDTMLEILAARTYFKNRKLSTSESLIFAAMAHVLHGNRPYALSRTSHPLTPYAPKGEFIYKNLIEHTWNKINRMYNARDFFEWNNPSSSSHQEDVMKLNENLPIKADVIITSPPFASSFKFYTQNWLRLWFAGWEPKDFEEANLLYFDDKQNNDMDIYYDYFESCSKMLKPKGRMVLHLGKSKNMNMGLELIKRSNKWFKFVYLGEENVSNIESFGIKDVGSTTDHQYLFLEKK